MSTKRAGFVLLFSVVVLAIYAPSLDGPFVSDDLFYLAANPYVQTLSFENATAILDPAGEPAVLTLNYAPVHLFVHALEWSLFGRATRGYHVVNLLLHGLVGWLLVVFLRRGGLGEVGAGLAGLVFLVHPANVEAVAWIFQTKTILSTAFALGALLLARRHPRWAGLLFVLGLLTKISAAFALPVFAVLIFRESDAAKRVDSDRVSASTRVDAHAWRAWIAWCAVFCLVSVLVWRAIDHTAVGDERTHFDLLSTSATMLALAMRYLLMAVSAYGVSAFQELAPVRTLGDAWVLAGAGAITLLGLRLRHTLRRRDFEAACWVLALAAFVPVSQIVPFRHPIADRYLYSILPGLLGGAAFALEGAFRGLARRRAGAARALRIGACAVVCSLCLGFAYQTRDRAALWTSARALSEDAARHFPNGVEAQRLAVFDAAQRGDAAGAARALTVAFDLGVADFGEYLANPAYARVRDDPAFYAVIEKMAGYWTLRARVVENPSQRELQTYANAHFVRGELAESIGMLERALERGGPADEEIARDLAARRLQLRLSERLGRPVGSAGRSR